jgi:hypothetical protein
MKFCDDLDFDYLSFENILLMTWILATFEVLTYYELVLVNLANFYSLVFDPAGPLGKGKDKN